MPDEPFQWPEWPAEYPPSNYNSNYQRVEQSSIPAFRRTPYYGTPPTSQPPAQAQATNTQTNYYPDISQFERYVTPDEIMQYSPYIFPTSSYRTQPYQSSASSAPQTNIPNQQPSTASAHPQILNTTTHESSQKTHTVTDTDSGHDSKRRRIESPAGLQATSTQQSTTGNTQQGAYQSRYSSTQHSSQTTHGTTSYSTNNILQSPILPPARQSAPQAANEATYQHQYSSTHHLPQPTPKSTPSFTNQPSRAPASPPAPSPSPQTTTQAANHATPRPKNSPTVRARQNPRKSKPRPAAQTVNTPTPPPAQQPTHQVASQSTPQATFQHKPYQPPQHTTRQTPPQSAHQPTQPTTQAPNQAVYGSTHQEPHKPTPQPTRQPLVTSLLSAYEPEESELLNSMPQSVQRLQNPTPKPQQPPAQRDVQKAPVQPTTQATPVLGQQNRPQSAYLPVHQPSPEAPPKSSPQPQPAQQPAHQGRSQNGPKTVYLPAHHTKQQASKKASSQLTRKSKKPATQPARQSSATQRTQPHAPQSRPQNSPPDGYASAEPLAAEALLNAFPHLAHTQQSTPPATQPASQSAATQPAQQQAPQTGTQTSPPIRYVFSERLVEEALLKAFGHRVPQPPGQPGPEYKPQGQTTLPAPHQTTQQAPQRSTPQSSQQPSQEGTQNAGPRPVQQTTHPNEPRSTPQSGYAPRFSSSPYVPPFPPQQPSAPPAAYKDPSAPTPPRKRGRPPRVSQLQRPQAPYENLVSFSFQPKDATDKTFLKTRADIVQDLREGDAVEKLAYDPRTIARDVLIASGRHPTEPSLNHHLLRLRDVFSYVDVSSDLTTFRWDLVDPKPPRDHMQTEQTQWQPIPKKPVPPVAPPPQVAVKVLPTTFPTNTPVQQHFHPPQSQKPSQSTTKPQPQPQIQLPAPPKPQPRVELPETPKRKMPGSGRPGRPPKSTKPEVVIANPMNLAYSVFACKWGNCQAELHNFEMLKKHIFKVHVTYQITCGWKGCQFTGTLPAAALMKHVHTEHLEPVGWKLGDGPSVPTSVDQGSSAALTIPDTGLPNSQDSLIFPASYSSVRAFNRVYGNHTQSDKAREILKAVQRLKSHIGIGLDPGGCELATPARNERVSNDEEVYQVRSAT